MTIPPEYEQYHKTGRFPASYSQQHIDAVQRLFAPDEEAVDYWQTFWVPGRDANGEIITNLFKPVRMHVTGMNQDGYPVSRHWDWQ